MSAARAMNDRPSYFVLVLLAAVETLSHRPIEPAKRQFVISTVLSVRTSFQHHRLMSSVTMSHPRHGRDLFSRISRPASAASRVPKAQHGPGTPCDVDDKPVRTDCLVSPT